MRQFFLLASLTCLLFLAQTSDACAQTVDKFENLVIYYNSADYKDPKLLVYYPDGKTEEVTYKDVPTGMTQMLAIDKMLSLHLLELINKFGKEGWHLNQANGFIYFLERKLP